MKRAVLFQQWQQRSCHKNEDMSSAILQLRGSSGLIFAQAASPYCSGERYVVDYHLSLAIGLQIGACNVACLSISEQTKLAALSQTEWPNL
jgi:hypothetical protein